MKPSEIKLRLKQLDFEEYKYYEIQSFLYTNKTPLKAITKIVMNNNHLLLHIGDSVIVEC